MPTYRNDSSGVLQITDIWGNVVLIPSSLSVESYHFNVHAGFTKISDEPLWNPVLARHQVSSSGPGDDQVIQLHSAVRYILIWKVSGAEVSAFLQSIENAPALALLGEDQSWVSQIDSRASQLVLRFNDIGSCEVVESSEDIRTS